MFFCILSLLLCMVFLCTGSAHAQSVFFHRQRFDTIVMPPWFSQELPLHYHLHARWTGSLCSVGLSDSEVAATTKMCQHWHRKIWSDSLNKKWNKVHKVKSNVIGATTEKVHWIVLLRIHFQSTCKCNILRLQRNSPSTDFEFHDYHKGASHFLFPPTKSPVSCFCVSAESASLSRATASAMPPQRSICSLLLLFLKDRLRRAAEAVWRTCWLGLRSRATSGGIPLSFSTCSGDEVIRGVNSTGVEGVITHRLTWQWFVPSETVLIVRDYTESSTEERNKNLPGARLLNKRRRAASRSRTCPH